MTFREWFITRATDFTWACISLFLAIFCVWSFSSFFLSIAAFLFVALIAVAPLLCLLLPIFLVYLLVRGAIDFLRVQK